MLRTAPTEKDARRLVPLCKTRGMSSVGRSDIEHFSQNTRFKSLPVGWPVIFQEIPPHVFAGVEAGNNRIQDSCGTIDDVEWWMKSMLGELAGRDWLGILIRDPTGIDS